MARKTKKKSELTDQSSWSPNQMARATTAARAMSPVRQPGRGAESSEEGSESMGVMSAVELSTATP